MSYIDVFMIFPFERAQMMTKDIITIIIRRWVQTIEKEILLNIEELKNSR